MSELFGKLFAVILFVLVLALLNIRNVSPKNFCLMNPDEAICEKWRRENDCIYLYNSTNNITDLGFSRHFQKRSSDLDMGFCHLDMGINATYNILSLNFGDIEVSPSKGFKSSARIFFNWPITIRHRVTHFTLQNCDFSIQTMRENLG